MRMRAALAPVCLLVLLAGAWEGAVRLYGVPPYILPKPSRILAVFFLRFPMIGHHAAITLIEIVLGVAVAAVVGFGLAVLIYHSRLVERALHPLIVASQMVPVFAVAPLLVFWFGYGVWPKAVVAALIGFFPMVVNTVDGLGAASGESVDLFRSLGASRVQILVKLRFPAALPLVLSGVKVGTTLAVVGATIGEWIGAERGLGYLMVQSNARLQMDVVFAAILALTLLGLCLFGALRTIERRLLRWRQAGQSHRTAAVNR